MKKLNKKEFDIKYKYLKFYFLMFKTRQQIRECYIYIL